MNIMRDTLHTIKNFGKAKDPIILEPSAPTAQKTNPIKFEITPPPSITEELLACLKTESADDNTRIFISIPKSLKNRFKTECDKNGQTMSAVLVLGIKRYLTTLIILFFLTPIFAADQSSYTTGELLAFVEKPNILPDITVGTKERIGYGNGETIDSPAQPDLYAGLYAKIDFISTAEIRNRKESGRTRQAEVLHNLSDILAHEQMITFLSSQKTTYLDRKRIMEQRIERGFSEQIEIIPIEQHLITIETDLQSFRANVRDAQLNIAGLAAEKWKELYSAVQKWNKKL